VKKITIIKLFFAFFLPVLIIFSSTFNLTIIGISFNEDFIISIKNTPPIIDGNFSSIENEWTNANSTEGTIDDLPIKIWVCHNETNLSLYIAISLELEIHPSNEFLGIIFFNSSNENVTDFLDVKIIQNQNLDNLSLHQSSFFDLNIINGTNYNLDANTQGNGSCKLDGKATKYEFEIKFNENNTDKEDVFLNTSQIYALKFVYGADPDYPDYNLSSSILKYSEILKIQLGSIEESEELPPDLTELIINTLTVLFFICVGVLYGYFGFYIFKTKRR